MGVRRIDLSADKLERLLLWDEGIRSKLYYDACGVPTIGVGRNLRSRGLDADEIFVLFRRDIENAEDIAHKFANLYDYVVWDGIGEVRQAVLISMAFNLGNRLTRFKRLQAALNKFDYDAAADEMLRSKWAQQVKSRAHRLAEMMRSGSWPKRIAF